MSIIKHKRKSLYIKLFFYCELIPMTFYLLLMNKMSMGDLIIGLILLGILHALIRCADEIIIVIQEK